MPFKIGDDKVRKNEFREWLSYRIQIKPVNDCISRCQTVEQSLNVDLDTEFQLDQGVGLMKRMQYSIADQRAAKDVPAGFSFRTNSNIRFRMANLRAAVNSYFKFCHDDSEHENQSM